MKQKYKRKKLKTKMLVRNRPVKSLTVVLCKIFESILRDKIVELGEA